MELRGQKEDVIRPITQYVMDKKPEKWSFYASIGVKKLYGWKTTNFDESENGAAKAQIARATLGNVEKRCFSENQVVINQAFHPATGYICRSKFGFYPQLLDIFVTNCEGILR